MWTLAGFGTVVVAANPGGSLTCCRMRLFGLSATLAWLPLEKKNLTPLAVTATRVRGTDSEAGMQARPTRGEKLLRSMLLRRNNANIRSHSFYVKQFIHLHCSLASLSHDGGLR